MSNYKRNFFILLLMAILACLSLSYYAYNQSTEIGTLVAQKAALTDTVTLYKTKAGKPAAYIPVFKGTKAQVLGAVKKTDPELFLKINSTPGIRSITSLNTKVEADSTVALDTMSVVLTPSKDGKDTTTKVFAQASIKTEFYDAKVTVDGDSARLQHTDYIKIDFMTRDKSNGFLKPKTYITDVVVDNPHVSILGLKSFEITPKSNKGLKISLGIVVAAGAYLLLK